MKKILLLALAFGLFPAMALADSLEQRQLSKIKAKEVLKFPQSCNIEERVIAAAKKVYEQNPNDFAAVYNYAVTLSAGDCDDAAPAYIVPNQITLAKKMFKKALTLKPSSPSCFAGLGFLTMLESGLSEAFIWGNNALDSNLFPSAVKAHRMAAQQALEYYTSALKHGYTGTFLETLKEEKQELEKVLNSLKASETKKKITKKVAKKK